MPGVHPTTYAVGFTTSSKVMVPPTVGYALTAPGQGLRGTVDVMVDRTHRHLGRIEAARRAFDTPDAWTTGPARQVPETPNGARP
ncbi:hypothetical protein [Streptomyces sp. NPDC058330]|uniref:hypothetical protein n=1 Tax=Streptomyces sp. NPDC058330 TaxID=3346449 RepID=UPI0036EA3E59